jgi:hypothetical protein
LPSTEDKSTISASTLEHAQAIDSPLLSTQRSVVAATLTHAQALAPAAVSLVGADSVNGAPLTHAQALAAIPLSTGTQINAAGLLHGHALAAPDLATASLLTPAALSHLQALAAGSATAGGALVPATLTHLHNLAAPSLSTALGVIPAALSHLQTVRAPTLIYDDGSASLEGSSMARWSYTATATHWARTGRDDWSRVATYAAPVSFLCDYKIEAQKSMDAEGEEFTARLIVYTGRANIQRGDYVLIGSSSSASPIGVEGAREVRTVTQYADTFSRVADDFMLQTI